MKKLSVFALLCIAILVLAGCNFLSKGSISGTVTDDFTKANLAGVTITVNGVTATTDADGKYTVAGVSVGAQTLKASKVGYQDATATVTVAKDQTATCDIALKVVAGITGVITDKQTEAPIKDAEVAVGDVTTKTDANGKYILFTSAGEKDVTVTAKDYFVETGKVTVEANKAASFDVAMTEGAYIEGIVTDGQGGPALADATVTYKEVTAKTDATGNFKMMVAAGTDAADVLVTKFGRSTTKIQNVATKFGQTVHFDVPNKAAFSPDNAQSAPTITVTGVVDGDTLKGQVPVTVEVNSGENLTSIIYVWFGGMERSPRDGFIQNVDKATVTFDTTKYPNGDSFVRVLVYDNQDNASMLFVPVKIQNSFVPADMGNMRLEAYSIGENISFYKKGREALYAKHDLQGNPNVMNLGLTTLDLGTINAAPGNGTLFVRVRWDAVAGAVGYTVSRSFDGTNFTFLGNVKTGSYDDYSPALTVGQKTYYMITPYNGYGPGKGKTADVTPLPVFNVELVGPANGESNVSLTPTFTWKNVCPEGQFPEGTAFSSSISLYDATSYQIWAKSGILTQSIALPGALNPLGVYSWDITTSFAQKLYKYDPANKTDYSVAYSFSGEYKTDAKTGAIIGTGSINGEFVFTTGTGTN